MNIEELKALLEIVSERDIAELELEQEGTKLRIRRALHNNAAPVAHLDSPGSEQAPTPEITSERVQVAATEASEDGLAIVRSPMVGTFYRQPEPGAEPFTREGTFVQRGQVLCIIEAMKLMNEIESEYQGELVKIFVDNGQAVQFGDKLFAIREA